MDKNHLVPVKNFENPYLIQELVQYHAGYHINVTSGWSVKYASTEVGHLYRYVLFNTNNSEAIFIFNSY